MNDLPRDDDLRRVFGRLRAADRRAAPPVEALFAQVRGRASRRPVRWRQVAALAGAAAVIVMAWIAWPARVPAIDERTLARAVEIAAWQPPTDELWQFGPQPVSDEFSGLELVTLSGLEPDGTPGASSGEEVPAALPLGPGSA